MPRRQLGSYCTQKLFMKHNLSYVNKYPSFSCFCLRMKDSSLTHNAAFIYLTTQLFWSVCLHADQSFFWRTEFGRGEQESTARPWADFCQLHSHSAFIPVSVPDATFIPRFNAKRALAEQTREHRIPMLKTHTCCVWHHCYSAQSEYFNHCASGERLDKVNTPIDIEVATGTTIGLLWRP